nr:hypothetical protein [Microbacterium aurantiacum]
MTGTRGPGVGEDLVQMRGDVGDAGRGGREHPGEVVDVYAEGGGEDGGTGEELTSRE